MSILNTRDQEFVKAKKLFEEYKKNVHVVANSIGLFDTEDENYPVAETQYEEWETETLNKVYQAFNKDYLQLIKNEEYFFGCPLDVYKMHFKERVEAYYTASKNSSEVGFILNEFRIGKLDFDHGISDTSTTTIIEVNLKLRYNYLLERLTNLGYNTEGMLDIDRATQSKISPIESEIDLSENNGKKRVIFMYELGIIQYLKDHYKKANLSNNKLAQLLSSFTGIKPDTLQSYVNPLLNHEDRVNQRNNPYSNQENVDWVRNILITEFHIESSDNA